MNRYMEMAIEEARDGIRKHHGGPFGCVIVKDGNVIGRGHNRVVVNHDPTCHGEMMAIRDACEKTGDFNLEGCELYTTGQPCPMCRGAIMWAGITKVYYGCNVEDTERIGFRDNVFYHTDFNKMEVELEREGCLLLYDEYMKIEDRTMY